MDVLAFLWHLILGLAITGALFGTGFLVACCWRPDAQADDSPLHHLLVALGWGFGLVPFISFSLVFFPNLALVPGVPLAVAAVVSALAVWRLRRRGGPWIPPALRTGWAEARPVLLAAGAVWLVYLLKYDRSVCFLESCIHRVVLQVLKLHPKDVYLLFSNQDDQRLGNPAVISSFVVLYRGLGFRLLYAFLGFAAALGGYTLARRMFGSRAIAWIALFALPLNPYVAKIPLLDENLLTLGFSSLFLPLVLRNRVPWAYVGLMYGLAVMMQHAAILSGLAICYAIVVYPVRHERWRAFIVAFVLFVLVTTVCHAHHYLALGSLLRFESFGQIPAFPHRFFGMYEGLLQWPFAAELVRTPWNPFPTFLMWPLYLADLLGLLLFAAMATGIVWLLRGRRQDGVFWLLWFVLPYTALAVQENWDVPNKMGTLYFLFHPILMWALAGVRAAWERPLRWGVPLVAVSLLSGAGIEALRHLDVPADERYYVARYGDRREDPAYVAAERELVTDVAPWPDYGRVGPLSQVFDPAKFRTLLDEIIDPTIDHKGTPYGWFPDERVAPGAPPVVLEIDLRQRLFDASSPFVREAAPGVAVDLDLTVPGPTRALSNIPVTWSPRPMTALVTAHGAPVTGVYLLFEEWSDEKARREYLQERYSRGLQMVLGWPEHELLATQTLPKSDAVIRLRVPSGPFSLVESVNNSGQLYLAWQGVVAPDAVELKGPRKVFHN